MVKPVFHVLILLTLIMSCTEYDKTPSKGSPAIDLTVKVDTIITSDISIRKNNLKLKADSFIHSNLDTSAFHWTFGPNDTDLPKYLKLFKQDNIKTTYAYSNKNYPKKSKASSYQHFILFMIEYHDEESSMAAFDRFVKDTENFQLDKEQVNEVDYQRIQRIHGVSKYGGLVGQKENYVFSLVETCGSPGSYKFRTWPAYEKNFIESIFDNSDSSSTVLNADCGKMKYVKQGIK